MAVKVDYKKDFKHLYLPKAAPEIVDVESLRYIMIAGEGDPNGPEFARATEALYSLTYAVKMSYKSAEPPEGYYEYTVFPLEGIWDLIDLSKPATDKSNLKYTIMIRQPDFLTVPGFERFLEQTKKKKPNPYLDRLVFEEMRDGLSCQMMHLGSFDSEPASFARMEAYSGENGYIRTCKTHREIYLTDPRRTEPAKSKTVLRFKVEKRDEFARTSDTHALPTSRRK